MSYIFLNPIRDYTNLFYKRTISADFGNPAHVGFSIALISSTQSTNS